MRLLFTGDINFRGKENMTFSEAHFSRLKEILKLYYNEWEEEAKVYAKRITELQKMSV